MRATITLLWITLTFPTLATGQEVLLSLPGESSGDRFGDDLSPGQDFDGDGIPDFLVGASTAANGYGRCYVLSGVDATEIASFTGTNYLDFLGRVADLGDINGDGWGDFLIGSWEADFAGSQSGRVSVISGKTMSVMHNLDGENSGDNFGQSIDAAGDVNADGIPDFIVGAPVWNSRGAAYVYSGADFSLLHRFEGENNFDSFGFSVAGAGDMDGDGHDDLLVGALLDIFVAQIRGRVYFYSGKTGNLIRKITGNESLGFFGRAVDGAGDVDGDGFADALIGADGEAGGSGRAYVYSGLFGTKIFSWKGSGSAQLGAGVAGAGDINGDGIPDLLVGATYHDQQITDQGAAFLYSGASGRELYRFDGSQTGSLFGAAVAGSKDLDGDGLREILVGAPLENATGNVTVFAGNDLFLQASDTAPQVGNTLRLSVRGGTPGQPAGLFLVAVDGTPLFHALGYGWLDANGEWDYQVTVPAGGSGMSFQLRAYALDASGRPVDSGSETINL